MLLGCATLCERTGGGAEGRWELCWGLSRGGGASEEGAEVGGGGNCCRGSGLGGRAMEGAAKPAGWMLSPADTGWLSRGRVGLSFPGGATALGSVLAGGTGACGTGPTGCWGALAAAVAELWCAGEPAPRTALLTLVAAAGMGAGATPAWPGLGSGPNSCFLTDDGVGTLGWGTYGVGLGVWGEPAAGDVLGAMVVAAAVLAEVTGAPELAAACSLWVELGRAWPAVPLVPPLCLGELLALPGLTGRTGKGPQVLAAGEKVPPN